MAAANQPGRALPRRVGASVASADPGGPMVGRTAVARLFCGLRLPPFFGRRPRDTGDTPGNLAEPRPDRPGGCTPHWRYEARDPRRPRRPRLKPQDGAKPAVNQTVNKTPEPPHLLVRRAGTHRRRAAGRSRPAERDERMRTRPAHFTPK